MVRKEAWGDLSHECYMNNVSGICSRSPGRGEGKGRERGKSERFKRIRCAYPYEGCPLLDHPAPVETT